MPSERCSGVWMKKPAGLHGGDDVLTGRHHLVLVEALEAGPLDLPDLEVCTLGDRERQTGCAHDDEQTELHGFLLGDQALGPGTT